MRFSVICLYHRGRRVEDRRLANQQPVRGELRVEWVHDPRRLRVVRYATLRAVGQGGVNGTLLPDLLEPELIGMVSDGFSLSGFEILDGIEYRQSWIVRTTIRDGD